MRDCLNKSVFSTIKKDNELDKASMRLDSIVRSIKAKRVRENEKKLVKCFLCCGLHRMRDCPERSKMFAISKANEEDLVKSEVLKLRSMILNSMTAKRNCKQKGLIYMGINIAGQKKSALVDTRASDLFISVKLMGKIDLSVSKSTKIKNVNSKKVSTVGVADRSIERQRRLLANSFI